MHSVFGLATEFFVCSLLHASQITRPQAAVMPAIYPAIAAVIAADVAVVKLPMVLLPRSRTKDRQRPGCVLAQQNRAASHLFAEKLSRALKQRGDSSQPQGPLEGALHHTAPIRARTRVHAHLTHSPTCPPTMGLSRGAV